MEVLFSSFLALLLCILVVPAIILLYSGPLLWRRRTNSNDTQLPPSPGGGLPLVGHLHLLGSLPHRGLRSIALKHGPVVLLRLGRVPTVLVSSAAAAEEVLKTRDLAFASRPVSAMAERLLYGRDVAFAPYGEYWRQTRRICVAYLLSVRRIQSFRHVREQEAGELVARIRRCQPSKKPIELGELIVAYANNVVSRAAFGDESWRGLYEGEDGDRGRRVRHVIDEFQKLLATHPVGEILPCLGWVDVLTGLERRIQSTFQALDAVLDKVIDDHRRRPQVDRPTQQDDHRDFVDVLLDVNRNDKEYGFRLQTNEIKAIILDMFAAGTDPVTTAMEWVMAELVTHPSAMRRVQAEIRTAVGEAGTSVTEEHLLAAEALPYLKAVIKETLRLHAPLPLLLPHQTVEDTELLGYRVPARTRVVVNGWSIARDPATWGHDAEEFLPDRFLSGVDYKEQSLELIPFGAGRRGCPGVGFAEQTIQIGLASLLYQFDWEAPSAALDMTEVKGTTVHIKAGLPLLAKPWVRC